MAEEFDPEHSLLDYRRGDRPSWGELADARAAMTLEVPDQDEIIPDVARDLETILNDTHVGGGAHLAAVRVPPNDVFDWWLAGGASVPEWLKRDLLASDALAEVLPALDLSADRDPQDYVSADQLSGDYTGIEWEQIRAHTLDGYLAVRLVDGGAYYNFLEPPFQDGEVETSDRVKELYGDRVDAKRLGERFVEAVFDERYGEFAACKTCNTWCDWFYIRWAWSHTYICFDQRTRLAWVLVTTDRD